MTASPTKTDRSSPLKTSTPRFLKGLLTPLVLVFGLLSLSSANVYAALPSNQAIYQPSQAELTLKVKNGEIVIKHGYFEGAWYPNLNWVPLAVTYDNFDSSVKSLIRSHTDYPRIAPGVFQDQNYNLIRQTADGYRWNDPRGNWIEYNLAGEVTRYGNRNGLTASLQHSGSVGTNATGGITGILDANGNQAIWFDYTGTDLTRIRDRANRSVQYTYDANHQISGISDSAGNTWGYSVAVDTQSVTYTDAAGNTKTYLTTNLRIVETDPEGHATTRILNNNGAPVSTTQADGNASKITRDFDNAKNIFYERQSEASGKIIETWYELKQDRGRGEYLRQDINGITVGKQSLDTATRTTTYTDARGLNTLVTRDQWGNITKTIYPDGSSVTTQYEPSYSNITQHTDENGSTTQYSYDAHGNLIKTIEALGRPEQRTTQYTYDTDGQRTSMTRKGDANTVDASTQYAYDTNGNLITVTDPEGGITRYTYDALGNPLTQTDPNGQLWKRAYDNQGRLLSVTDPLNRSTSISYNKAGLPISLTDAAGNSSSLGYDATGRLLSVTDPYGGNTRYTYDKAGNPITLTDAENHTQKQDYDLNDRLIKQTDGNGNTTQFQYGDQASGLNGLLVKIIYPTLSQDLQYDQRDRITRSSDTAAGTALALDNGATQTTSHQYDAAGNLTQVTDPAGRNNGTRYNAHNEITQSIDPAGNTTDYGYDARGNLISVTDAKGNTHRFDYDKLDRMVKETRPLGQTISYSYDANGNLIQVTDPKGQIKKYTYDAANRRLKEQHYLAGNTTTPVKTISYTYNTLDRLTGYNDGNTSATYTYDTKQLRQIGESVTYATNGAPFTLASSTAYNALGQKTSHTYPDGATYTYSYDTNNQLSTVNLPQGYGSITLNSYLWNVPSQITLPGGTVRNYSYDGLLRLKELDIKDPGQSQVLNTQYGYDLTGNIVSKAISATGATATTSYSYDTLDHLTGATYSNSSQTNESYSYDPLANRITGSNANAQGSNHSYNANNQLTQAGSVSYTYDANGNTTSQTDSSDPTNTRSYVYDTDNRLIEVHDASNAIIATYRYDPFGRRLSKTLTGSSTYYFYSAEGLIAEADSNGQITQSYGYAPNTTFSTNPLWTKLSTAGTATYYTYQNDHLGTPQKLLNQSGVTVWSATYDAFGRATVDPASTISNNLRLPGQYADQETGLHYNWNRYYDPVNGGRYISSDPIGLSGGINTYTYVTGNPTNYIDPTGEVAFLIPMAVAYGSCISSCLATSAAVNKITSECEKDPLLNGGDVGSCAVGCMLGPLGVGGAHAWKAMKVAKAAKAAKKVAKDVAKRPSSFRKKTIQDSWDNATDGSKPRTKACPTCGKDVEVAPGQGRRDWDVDHQPKWKDRDLSGMDRKQVLDEYNKDVRLRCPSCNRSDN